MRNSSNRKKALSKTIPSLSFPGCPIFKSEGLYTSSRSSKSFSSLCKSDIDLQVHGISMSGQTYKTLKNSKVSSTGFPTQKITTIDRPLSPIPFRSRSRSFHSSSELYARNNKERKDGIEYKSDSTERLSSMKHRIPQSSLNTPSKSIQILEGKSLNHEEEKREKIAMIILNTDCTGELFNHIWNYSDIHICADGGANRIYDTIVSKEEDQQFTTMEMNFIPEYIKGDLDSLRSDARRFYESKGCQVIQDPDQDSNDLDKCFDILLNHNQKNENIFKDEASQGIISKVYIVGAVGSRFDHSMSNVNALYKYSSEFDQVILVGVESFVMLLEPNVEYSIKRNLAMEGRTCGLLPLGTMVESVTTSGLRWNLHNHKLGFFNVKRLKDKDEVDTNCLFSSSNEIVDDENVTIKASEPLIWTTVIKEELVKPMVLVKENRN